MLKASERIFSSLSRAGIESSVCMWTVKGPVLRIVRYFSFFSCTVGEGEERGIKLEAT